MIKSITVCAKQDEHVNDAATMLAALDASSGCDPDNVTAAKDAIIDLLHLIRAEGGDAEAELASVKNHFEAEISQISKCEFCDYCKDCRDAK
jgi:hypothetical protein